MASDIPLENFEGLGWRCKNGGYHDRHVVFGESPSQNLWIYTALGEAIGLPVDKDKLAETFKKCQETSEGTFWLMSRLPGKQYPPISRDELIGLFVLMEKRGEELIAEILENEGTWLRYNWLFNIYTLWETIGAFWRAKDKHRNYLWKNEELAAYKLLFSFRGPDRVFFKKALGQRTTYWEDLLWTLHKYWTNWRGSPGEKNILWLQCKRLKDDFVNKIDIETNFKLYFPVDHIFLDKLEENR